MNVSFCESGERWDTFVATMPEALSYHQWSWRQIVHDTFGHRSFYLAAGNGSIEGVLPLFFIESRLFGKFLVSVPFSSYGGILAASEKARTSLLRASIDLARDLGARHIELRQGAANSTGFVDVAPKVTMEVDLPSTVEELWARFSGKLRKRIRAGRKRGLSAEWDCGEAVENFYRVFAVNMRNLGTPVYPLQLFLNIRRSQPDSVKVLILRFESRLAAAAFLIRHGTTLELPWAASAPEFRDIFSTNVLYCTLLERAVEEGFRKVDLGRCTPGSGNHQFKQRWGARGRPLHWCYWLSPNASIPEIRPNNPRYMWATRLWKFLPLGVANSLGPKIVRSIP